MKLIVGDIHGCYEELTDLLGCAGVGPADEVISVGDMIHRGPDSLRVLEFFRTRPGAVALQGNHERKHVRSAGRDPADLSDEPARFRRECGHRYAEAVSAFAGLPKFLSLPEALVVHAAVEPGRPAHRQDERVLTGSLRGEEKLAREYRRPWWELYDGDRPVVVGHRDFRGDGRPFVYKDRVFGLDTGCARGGRLTGLLLPSFRLVSVKSRVDCRRPASSRAVRPLEPPVPAPPEDGLDWNLSELLAEPGPASRSTRLRGLQAGVREAMDELGRTVRREHRRILSQLSGKRGFHQADTRRVLYGRAVGDHPLRRLLCLERDGRLSPDNLLDAVPARTPRELFELLRESRAEQRLE
jgi:serine/threonine protein phosphatase 1